MFQLVNNAGISDQELEAALTDALKGKTLKKVLLIPPDATRLHSRAGQITKIYYDTLTAAGCHVDVLPALGTHEAMSRRECETFLGVPYEALIVHNWREDVVRLGEVPASFVSEVSGGVMNEPVAVEVNRLLLDTSYDLLISAGQVVPHEVVGMANYSKNIFVGCGGSQMINSSHMLSAFYGIENILGRAGTPVRRVFDYAEEQFIAHLPLLYVLTVTTQGPEGTRLDGLFIGRGRELFNQAAALSREKNITMVGAPLKTCVVYLDGDEFKSTWLGNKAVYRTRLAMADGGRLIIIGPGVKRFGEDDQVDALIRKYGYAGRQRLLELARDNQDLRENLSAAAHLIHGSPDGRFTVTYAVRQLSRAEIEGVGFGYMPLEEALRLYDPSQLKDGWNTVNGEEIYFISNPALGLWADAAGFEKS